MKLLGILAALLLTVGAAVALSDADADYGGGSGGGGRPVALGDVRLVSVESCDELLAWFQEAAEDSVALYGGAGRDMAFAIEDSAVAAPSGGAAGGGAERATGQPVPTVAAAPANGVGDGDASFSTTNVQERDVDEPDVVKTDGDVLVSVAYDGLRIVDVGDEEPELVSTLDLPEGGGEIILSGDRVLVLSTTWRDDPNASTTSDPGASGREMMSVPAGHPVTVLTSVDISDPRAPRIIETSELPGTYRSARAVGEAVRVVVVHSPMIGDPAAIETMTLDQWSPAVGSDCASVARTSEPEGVSTTTIVTLDLQGSLEELDRDSVVADAGTIYASTDRLVVATSRWSQTMQPQDGGQQVSTELHAFDITDPAQTEYVGSGAVAGYLLNQFALSAHEGNLRVATTEEPPWDESADVQQTSSGITVLDASMQQIGRINGLGVTERIHAVRYLGDVAYVVTFRQTDPLFAIDLSDPTAPRVAGELKIPGYSAYLHPIDEGRLVGVGQDATDEGQTLGSQVSTFDVSSVDSPTRIDAVRIDGSSSTVEWDHRAFLWWSASRTVVIPIDVYGEPTAIDCPPDADCAMPVSQQFTGAVAFGISDDGSIVERGRVSHQPHTDPNGWWPSIQRSIVVGDALYTISEAGVLKSDLSSLEDRGYAAFPAPEQPKDPIGIAVPTQG